MITGANIKLEISEIISEAFIGVSDIYKTETVNFIKISSDAIGSVQSTTE